jgi:hypothetical protein
MNQYERGKHTPGFFLIERLAQALNMPTPWFYTRDDDMAELLLAYNLLPAEYKEKALAYVRKLAAEHATGDAGAAGGNDPSGPADSSTYSLSSPGQSPSTKPAQPPASDERNRK